jgi:hypothetical protein
VAEAPLDAETHYANGVLRQQTAGLVRRLRQQGHPGDILPLVAVPIGRLAESLRRMGQAALADGILAHAVHDGVPPSALAQGIAQYATPPTLVFGDPAAVMTVGPAGQITAGAPGPASDADSAAALANYLLERIGG